MYWLLIIRIIHFGNVVRYIGIYVYSNLTTHSCSTVCPSLTNRLWSQITVLLLMHSANRSMLPKTDMGIYLLVSMNIGFGRQ